jgi:hypothetical protein
MIIRAFKVPWEKDIIQLQYFDRDHYWRHVPSELMEVVEFPIPEEGKYLEVNVRFTDMQEVEWKWIKK